MGLDYKSQYKKSSENKVVDGLSRMDTFDGEL